MTAPGHNWRKSACLALVTIVVLIGMVVSGLGTRAANNSSSVAEGLYVIEYSEISVGDISHIMSVILGHEIDLSQYYGHSTEVEVTAPGINRMLMHSFGVPAGQANLSVMFSDYGIIMISLSTVPGKAMGSAPVITSPEDVIAALGAAGWGDLMSAANVTAVPREYGGYEVYDIFIDGVRLKYPVTVKEGFISGWFPAHPRVAHVIGYDPIQAVRDEASKYFDASTAKIRGPIYMPDLMDPYATRILPTYVVSSGGDTLYIQLDEVGAHTVIRATFAGSGPQLAPSPILAPYEVIPVQPGNQVNTAVVAVLAAVAAGGAATVVMRRRPGAK